MKSIFPRLLIWLYWPVIIFIGYYLNNLDDIHVHPEYKKWALAHLFLHSLPIFIYLVTFKKDPTSFPFLQILSLFNIVQYALPIFYIEIYDYQLGVLQESALENAFIAYSIFYCSFYIFRFVIRVKPIEFIPQNSRVNIVKIGAYVLLGIYMFKSQLPAIYHIGYVGIYIFIGVFIYLWKNRMINLYEKGIFILFFAYEFMQRALDGLLSPFALLVMFVCICIIISGSSKLIIGGLLILFLWFYSIFSVIKFGYRQEVWYGNKSRSFTEKIDLIRDLYKDNQLDKRVPMVKSYQGKDHFLWRFSYQMSGLSLVLSETPSRVPYWKEESYVPLFSKFVPRFMWPDKPEEVMGYEFGVRYRIMSTWNRSTSMNTPLLAEMYMNFGYEGLYLGSFLLGILLTTLDKLYNRKKVSYASRIIGMAMLFPLITWESNFSLTYGNLFLVTMALLFLYKVVPRYLK